MPSTGLCTTPGGSARRCSATSSSRRRLLITGDDHVVLYWHAFDTLMDLGLVNLAEKNLTECLETFGEHPLILERLATVNLVKGRTDAARIYLGVLRKTLFHHRLGERLARASRRRPESRGRFGDSASASPST